jgi:hypothetical protein
VARVASSRVFCHAMPCRPIIIVHFKFWERKQIAAIKKETQRMGAINPLGTWLIERTCMFAKVNYIETYLH